MDISTSYAEDILRQHLSAIEPYLASEDINEVMVNAADDIWVEERGVMRRVDATLSEEQVDRAITLIASKNGKPNAPLLDARLPGLRIAAARKPTALRGSMLCVRRFAARRISLDSYVENGAFDVVAVDPSEAASEQRELNSLKAAMRRGGSTIRDFFQWVVERRHNIVLSGSTSAGKTTLLNALLDLVPCSDRVITVEDTAELRLNVPNHVALEANQALGISVRDLVRLSLRCRPDRIVLGEVRGAEAFDLLDALNTGHPGSQVSLHADSSAMALPRLESMLRMAPETQNWPLHDLRRQIASTFRFVVHAQRVGPSRGPREIREILGVDANGSYQTRLLFSKIQLQDQHYE
ncbi:CpaF family protein [Achromobacter dolens]|jgi:Flp pilus assembly CpaF family ATPase|uniref:CpaF family protein n=1 Tax=Achromobacter TaxID=222 RepID=UPI0014668B62|nr:MULTISPECIES: ATPase, T2SS/T4P/T4SS family [Achromobacter]CAB3873299.1 Type IV secretion system protein PtlH [Achromobacter mucicolens]